MIEAENWLAYINGEAEYQYREHWHACVWLRHTPLLEIIDYGWGAGFYKEQTLHECIASGYSWCVAEPMIESRWKWWDEKLKKDQEDSK